MKGQTAPGTSDNKATIARAGWGDLPEKDIAKAVQAIGRTFPPHYQEALKRYSEKLAQRQPRQ